MNAVDAGGTRRFARAQAGAGGRGRRLEQFNYLAILISLVIGLAMAQVLTGLGRLIQARARVVFYWPSVVWAVLFLVIQIESWWSLFRMRGVQVWNFFAFLVVVAHPVGLYLICSLILPDPAEFSAARPVDLRANYFDHRHWFYGLIIAVSVTRLARPWVTPDAPLTALDVTVQIMIIGAAAVAMVTRNVVVHRALPVLACVLMATYYALVYIRLA
jgi:hypothetical protein